MKRVLAFLVTVVMLLAVLPTAVSADKADYDYDTREDGIYLTGYKGAGGEVTVDATIDDTPVVGIVYSTFSGNAALTGISLPASVTLIDDNAFAYCSKLSSFRAQGVKALGDYTFASCPKLASVSLPETLESIGSGAFEDCTSIREIDLPDSITEIGKSAFAGATALKTVTLPANLHTIVYNMFNGCSALTDVALPDSVTAIEKGAFLNCTALTKLTVGEGVTRIEEGAFDGAVNLTLYVKEDSEAQRYAEEHGIPYVSCDHTKTHQVVSVKPGYTHVGSANIVCDACNKVVGTVELPVLSLEDNFVDVKNNAWYANETRYCLDNNMVQGTDAKHVSPDANMTRASLVMVLYRMEGSPAVTYEAKFDDVPAKEWFANAVMWASENQIVKGISARGFGPNQNITRQEIAVILYRYAKEFKGYNVDKAGDISTFNDVADVADWSTDAFAWANGMGIITGTPGNTLSPTMNATRAQVIVMLYRFCNAYPAA